VDEHIAVPMLDDGGHEFWSEIVLMRSNKTGTSKTVDYHPEVDCTAQLC
jgi:hypothetical protein